MRTIALLTTGGTIEKIYDEQTGELKNRLSIMEAMLACLRLADARVVCQHIMSKDSLLMTEDDRGTIVRAVGEAIARGVQGVVVSHGTDTLHATGEALSVAFPAPPVPIVLTGAMRPFELQRSDALQNLTEALFATGVLTPGVYCVFHGRAIPFPGVRKDRERGTFVSEQS